MEQFVAVIDVGSSTTRLGMAGDEAPRVAFPSVVGVPRHAGLTGTLLQHETDIFAGDAAVEREGLLFLTRPVRGRRVASHEGLEQILHHAFFNALPMIPSETPLLWVEPTETRREDRERICEILFESFDVPRVGMASASTATIYATGRTTGIVLDSGENRTTINAVWEGYNLQYAVRSSEVAGSALTDDLIAHLRARGYAFSTPCDRRIAEEIKHTMCYVAANCEMERVAQAKQTNLDTYNLPDEQRIYLHNAQFMVPERLFASEPKGGTDGAPWGGWAHVAHEVVQRAPIYGQDTLYANIVLSGGNTMFPGIEQRMQCDVTALTAASGTKKTVKCVAFADRDLASWIGGSIIGSMLTFPDICLSRTEYHERGASAMHTRV